MTVCDLFPCCLCTKNLSFPTSSITHLYLFCRCNNREHCQISAEDFDFGPDTCPDTERYLEAHYVCTRKHSSFPPSGKIKISSQDDVFEIYIHWFRIKITIYKTIL